MIASKEWVKDILNKAFKKNNTYSEDEVRIGTWIDGKPIYRKVLTSTTPNCTQNGTTATSRISVSIPNINKCVNVRGVFTHNGYVANIPMANTVSGTLVFIDVQYIETEQNVIIMNTSKTYSNCPCNIIIEYTKTTD